MKKTAITLFVVLVMTLGIALVPSLTFAADYNFAGPPAFTINYPDGSKPDKPSAPDQVWAIKTPDGVVVQAGVGPIPKDIDVKDYAEKAYKPGLADTQKTLVTIKKNEEFTLESGQKAYYAEMEWKFEGSTLITTLVVTAYKDGKYVCLATHPWMGIDEVQEIVKSLKFK